MHLRMEAVPAAEILLVKLERAQGGCLGIDEAEEYQYACLLGQS